MSIMSAKHAAEVGVMLHELQAAAEAGAFSFSTNAWPNGTLTARLHIDDARHWYPEQGHIADDTRIWHVPVDAGEPDDGAVVLSVHGSAWREVLIRLIRLYLSAYEGPGPVLVRGRELSRAVAS